MKRFIMMISILVALSATQCSPTYDNPNDLFGDSYIDRSGIDVSNTNLVISEGEGDSFTVSLAAIPFYDVEINFAANLPDELAVSPGNLTFTRENYMDEQTVTIDAADNLIVAGAAFYELAPEVISLDGDYTNSSFPVINVVVNDNDLRPVIIQKVPYDGQENVDNTQQIMVTFSKDMDSVSVTDIANITVTNANDQSLGLFPGEYYADKKTALYTVKGMFKCNMDYTVTLNTNIKDSAGNSLEENNVFSFKTKSFSTNNVVPSYQLTYPYGAAVDSDGYLYVTEPTKLHKIDTNNMSALYQTRTLNSANNNTGKQIFVTKNNTLYLLDRTTGTSDEHIYKMSSWSSSNLSPLITNSSNYQFKLFATDTYVYTSYYNGEVSIKDTSLNDIGLYTNGLSVSDLFISGDYAYLGTVLTGLYIVNVSTPATPAFTAQYPSGTTSVSVPDVAVSGHYAYMSHGGQGLDVLDITTPSSPVLAGSYYDSHISNLPDICYLNGFIYAYTNDYGLQIIDVSDPEHPSYSGYKKYISTPAPVSLCAYKNSVFITDNNGTNGYCYKIDVSSLVGPVMVNNYNTNDNPVDGFHMNGRYAWVQYN